MLRLGWDAAAVPEGGQEVYLAMAGMSKTWNKDPAGHIYHEYCLKQAGLFGAPLPRLVPSAGSVRACPNAHNSSVHAKGARAVHRIVLISTVSLFCAPARPGGPVAAYTLLLARQQPHPCSLALPILCRTLPVLRPPLAAGSAYHSCTIARAVVA